MQTQDFTGRAPPGTQMPGRKRMRRTALEKPEGQADQRHDSRDRVERTQSIGEASGVIRRYGAGF